jgi:hypothetical protein
MNNPIGMNYGDYFLKFMRNQTIRGFNHTGTPQMRVYFCCGIISDGSLTSSPVQYRKIMDKGAR